MPLNRVGPGNMYQHITHTHNHLAGACPHACTYCSTQDMARRFPALKERYSGPPRLVDKELKVNYGTGKTIFVENCSDLFAEGIQTDFILLILGHCWKYPDNTYVFQSKNPGRIKSFFDRVSPGFFPPHFLIGTTAESNRSFLAMSISPTPLERLKAMRFLPAPSSKKFITIEPILRFDVAQFVSEICQTYADTIYIGSDSKNHGLPEPTGPEIKALVEGLRGAGKKVVLKSNLKRLYQGD